MREQIASSICQDDAACYEAAMAESNAVDSMITIAKNSLGEELDRHISSEKFRTSAYYDNLRQWTLDINDGSLDQYL